MLQPTILSGQREAISVWLDNASENALKQFRCTVCGKVVFEYYSDIKIIMAGEHNGVTKKAPLVIQCHGAITVMKDGQPITSRCKVKYQVS